MNMNLYLTFVRVKAGAPPTATKKPIEAQFEPFLEGGHP
jgi:hypothetical protein